MLFKKKASKEERIKKLKERQYENFKNSMDTAYENKLKEIEELKTKYANEFERIKNLCHINDYGNRYAKINLIYEIATDNLKELRDYESIEKTTCQDTNSKQIV